MDAGDHAMPFPEVVDVAVHALGEQGDLFDRLHRLEIHAVRIRSAFSRELVAAVVDRLEQGAFAVTSTSAPPEGEPVQLFGLPLQWAGPDLSEYLRTAARFRGASPSLWREIDYEERIHAMLMALSPSRSVEVMRTVDGAPYTPSTIRRVARSGGIPPHLENHQLDFPGCTALREAIDCDALMSFFTLLSPAEAGGTLGIHAMTMADFERAPGAANGQTGLAVELARHRRGQIDLEPGDLLVFNSGRFFHTVTPVEGKRPRWTIGGFLAASRRGDRVLYWA